MDKPISFDDLFPDRFLKAKDFNGRDAVVKISAVHIEVLEGDKGKIPTGILSLEGKAKQMTLNKTNGIALKAMFGPIASAWVGKRVQLYGVQVEAFGELQLAIRVRGSPDIPANIEFTTRLGRNKAAKFKLLKTGVAGSRPPPAAPAAPAAAAKPVEGITAADVPEGVDDSAAPWNSEPEGEEQS